MTVQTLTRSGQSATAGAAVLRRLRLALALVVPVVLAAAWLGTAHGPPAEQRTADAAVTFAPHASGTLREPTSLRAGPAGGALLADLAPGTALEIGGRLATAGGLRTHTALWVRVADGTAGTVGEGFVPAGAVAITAGDPPPLDMRDVPTEPPPPGDRLMRDEAGVGGASAASLPAAAAPASAAAAVGPVGVAWLPETVRPWADELRAAAERHGVDPQLLAIVLLVESGGHPEVVSPSGAIGLMQIMPATGADIAQRRGIEGFDAAWLYDPVTNIDYGAWYLRQLLGAFGRADDPDWQQSVEHAAAAYNGGPGHLQQHLAGAPLAAEAERYRRWVGGLWRERFAADSATYGAWLAAGGHRLVGAAEAWLEARSMR